MSGCFAMPPVRPGNGASHMRTFRWPINPRNRTNLCEISGVGRDQSWNRTCSTASF
jgi:hypothetical protein